MKSFERKEIFSQPLPKSLKKAIGKIYQVNKKIPLYTEKLEGKRRATYIENIVSRNQHRKKTLSLKRLHLLAQDEALPRIALERQVTGYRESLGWVNAHFQSIPLTLQTMQQLHHKIFPKGGVWRHKDSSIRCWDTVWRKNPPPDVVAGYMHQLHCLLEESWQLQQTEPLLLVATYMLDFFCIHPFQDGNGRAASIFKELMLKQFGLFIGDYISLEKIIRETRWYYEQSLQDSCEKWDQGEHNLLPWWSYFIDTLLDASEQLNSCLEREVKVQSQNILISPATGLF